MLIRSLQIVFIAAETTTHIFWILVKAGLDKLLELLGEVAGELGRVVLGDEEEDAHRMQVGIGWLTL
jgi:hypothetical protein